MDISLISSLVERGKNDYRLSILHNAEMADRSRELSIAYLCRRAGLSKSDALRLVTPPCQIQDHLANRHPWWTEQEQKRLDWTEKITIATLCINIGTIYALQSLQIDSQADIELRCNYTSPVDYWASPNFENEVDCFITELASPQLTGVTACRNFDLAFPIHHAVEGWLTFDRMTYQFGLSSDRRFANKTAAIVAASTSSASQAAERKIKKKVELPTPAQFRTFITTMCRDENVLFAWDPWITWLEHSLPVDHPELFVVRDGKFLMGLFVNRKCWTDTRKTDSILQFITDFIRKWRQLEACSVPFEAEQLARLNALHGWTLSIQRASASVIAMPDTTVLKTPLVLRQNITKSIDKLWDELPSDPTIIDAVIKHFDQIKVLVGKLPDTALPHANVMVNFEVNRADQPVNQRALSIIYKLKLSLGKG